MTDRQTDRQKTDFLSLDFVSIPCSAVKISIFSRFENKDVTYVSKQLSVVNYLTDSVCAPLCVASVVE